MTTITANDIPDDPAEIMVWLRAHAGKLDPLYSFEAGAREKLFGAYQHRLNVMEHDRLMPHSELLAIANKIEKHIARIVRDSLRDPSS